MDRQMGGRWDGVCSGDGRSEPWIIGVGGRERIRTKGRNKDYIAEMEVKSRPDDKQQENGLSIFRFKHAVLGDDL
ncbi:hypothetical protein T265_01332 [Opisthorchis viverrini]|uniref:Uncharacterized protein n=1 Tax=Opisthorchis viverrini TaxID=6198 RepID=A0A075AA74_OPIVI|nr:hypothetical protein T265_01332 [Opisthorchis viverrini]KER32645.1 hypothetical protein T265_01332 [Opisthorchis viverrini]